MAPAVASAEGKRTVKSLADLGIKNLPVNYVKDEDERPTVAYNNFSKEVPVISLANAGAAAGGAERAQLLREVRAACEEWGMFQIKDHGVPTELNSQIMCCSQEFFSLSVEEKMQYAIKAGQFVGYGNGSFINDDPLMDWRELYVATCSPSKARDIQSWPAKPLHLR